MIHATKKSLNDLADKVEDKEKSDIEAAISDLEEALKGNDKEAISEKTNKQTEDAGKHAERQIVHPCLCASLRIQGLPPAPYG